MLIWRASFVFDSYVLIAWTYLDAVTLVHPVFIRVCAMQHAPRDTGVVWLVPVSHTLAFPVEMMGSGASVLRASVSSLRNGDIMLLVTA